MSSLHADFDACGGKHPRQMTALETETIDSHKNFYNQVERESMSSM
jgi:hypothetical protein